MKTYLILIILLVTQISCNQVDKSNAKIFIDLSNSVSRSDDLSPEIDRIEFFQIDNSIPIDRVFELRKMENQIIFHHRGGKYANIELGIVAVNFQGDILWNYNQKGKGPGEFEYISCLTYLPYSDEILFQESRKGLFQFLDINGNPVRSFEFKGHCNDIMELPNNQFVANIQKESPGAFVQTSPLQHDLVFIDKQGNITERFLPHNDNGMGWFWYGETLLPGTKQLIYTNTLQYTLFTITPEGVDSTWSLDFGDFNVDTSRYLHPKGMEDIMMENDEPGVLSTRVVHSEKNLWVLAPRMKKTAELAVINKKTHSIKYYTQPKSHGFTYSGIPIPMFSLTQNMDCFVYSMPAIEALENWEKLSQEEQGKSDPKWKKLMENLDPESNPIVCMLYPK